MAIGRAPSVLTQASLGIECPLCFEDIDDCSSKMVITACHHNFHDVCVTTWIKKSNSDDPTCPSCRSNPLPLTRAVPLHKEHNPYVEDALVHLVRKGDLVGLTQKISTITNTEKRIKDPADKKKKTTLLHLAIRYHQFDIVKYLLEQKFDINAQDSDKNTPLHLAISENDQLIYTHLLDQGANPHARNDDGVTPFYRACSVGDMSAVNALLAKRSNPHKGKYNKASPLYVAAQNGHTDIVKLLINLKANVNKAVKTTGMTPLYAASSNGHLDIVKLLLESGANISACCHPDKFIGHRKSSPLFIAAQNGHADIVEHLLSNGANVNAQRLDGATALYIAANGNHLSTVEVLLRNGANKNLGRRASFFSRPTTPLDAATEQGHTEVASKLSEYN